MEGVFVWDLNSATCVKEINETTDPSANEGEVTCLCWLYNGTILATGGRDSTIRLWDVSGNFRYLETISAHKSSVNTMVFCEAHDYLVTAGRDSSINLWSTISLSPENLYKRLDNQGMVCPLIASMDGHLGDVSILTISEDGEYIFSGARDNSIRVWSFNARKCIREIKDQNNMMSTHKGDISGLFSCGGMSHLLSTSMDGSIHIHKLGSMAITNSLDDDMSTLSLDELLKGFSDDQNVSVAANDALVAIFKIFTSKGIACASMPSSMKYIAVSSGGNCIRIYNINIPELQLLHLQEFIGHSDSVNGVAPINDNTIVTVSSDYTVNVFNVDSGVRLMSFTAPSALSSVATADNIIFAAGKDYAIHTYSTEYRRFYGGIEQECRAANREMTDEMFDLCRFVGHSGKIRSIAYNKTCSALFSASEDGSVMIHVLPELQVKSLMDDSAEPLEEGCAHKIEDHTGVVLDVALSDDFDDCFYMASVGNDYALNVYRIDQKYHSLFSIESAHDCVIPCVTFGHASSNSMIFTGGWDHVIKVWNLDGELVKELQGHLERITDLCVSKDGKYLASASADKTICLWNIPQDFKLEKVFACSDECESVCFLGDKLVAAYVTGVVRIWSLEEE